MIVSKSFIIHSSDDQESDGVEHEEMEEEEEESVSSIWKKKIKIRNAKLIEAKSFPHFVCLVNPSSEAFNVLHQP